MKNCLIISAYFPPMGGVGVQRITKIVKYLPRCGWRPLVITIPKWSFRGERDESLCAELPPEAIIKRPFFIDYKKILPGEVANRLQFLWRRQVQPDRYRWWNHFALKAAKQMLMTHDIAAVLINVSPFSSLLLAEPLKKTLSVPLVINLRDAFSFNNYLLWQPHQKARQEAEALEKKVFPHCDAIIGVTPHLVRQYQALYPELSDKFHLLTNGYDEEDFDLKSGAPTDRFTIGYNGSISRLVPLEPLLQAMTRILKEKQIRLYLSIASKNSLKEIMGRHTSLLSAGLVEYHGFLPHRQSLQILSKADILTLMFANHPATEGAYSGKIFEYLRLNKPILLLHRQDSDLAALLRRCRAGRCVNIDDPESIDAALLDFYDQWRHGLWHHDPDWSVIRSFDYHQLTQKLTEWLEPR